MAGVAQARGIEGGGHVPGQERSHAVGQSGPGVGLMDHDGDPPAACGEVQRRADVAADAHQDVGRCLVKDASGLPDRTGQPSGQPEQVNGRFPRKRHPVDGGQFYAGGGNQPGFHAGGCAHREQPGVGHGGPQCGRDGQQGADMAGGSAARQDNGQVLGSHLVLRTLSCGCFAAGGSAGLPCAEFQQSLGPHGRRHLFAGERQNHPYGAQ